MTAILELPAPTSQPKRSDEAPAEAPTEFPSAWACGLDPDSADGHDRCRDIVPELIVELL